MLYLPIIARKPLPSGSPAQALVRDYLVQQLFNSDFSLECAGKLLHVHRGTPPLE